MKHYLVGYPGSQKIRPAVEYLLGKYFPLQRFFLINKNPIEEWSNFVADELEKIKDSHICFSLDDYFVADRYTEPMVIPLGDIACFRLGDCEFAENPTNELYCCSTQIAIWDRKKLIEILRHTTTPWDFEISGSKYMREKGWKTYWHNDLKYCGESALSERHPGKVSVKGLRDDDILEMISRGLLNKEELIVGQPLGEEIKWQDIL